MTKKRVSRTEFASGFIRGDNFREGGGWKSAITRVYTHTAHAHTHTHAHAPTCMHGEKLIHMVVASSNQYIEVINGHPIRRSWL